MVINRPLLKKNARIIIRCARPSVIGAAVIFILVSAVLSTLSGSVLGVNISPDEAQRYMNYYLSGNYEAILRMSADMIPPSSAYFINALISIVQYVFGAGFVIFLFNTVKRAGAVYGNLLDGFSLALKLIGLAFLQGILVFLWSLLLVIPGIIASYRYRMAYYLLLENPELGVVESMRRSRQMMHGHKWECFVLDLSFIGWRLLAALPYVGYAVMLWSTPYMETTYVLYYMSLAGNPVVVVDGPDDPSYPV